MQAGAKCLFEDQQVEGAMDLLFVQCDRLMELFLVKNEEDAQSSILGLCHGYDH
jgi:hypothetical protein